MSSREVSELVFVDDKEVDAVKQAVRGIRHRCRVEDDGGACADATRAACRTNGSGVSS